MLAYLLLGAGQILGLLVTAFGWPGIGLQLAVLAAYCWLTSFATIGPVPLGLLVAVSLISEASGAIISRQPAEVGMRRQLAITGLVGGAAGAGLGLLTPLLGTMFGALLGALIGSSIGAVTLKAGQERFGKLLGYAVSAGIRTGAGIIVAVFIFLTVIR